MTQREFRRAVEADDGDAVRTLIERDRSLLAHRWDDDEAGPLHLAARRDFVEVARILMDAGADPEQRNAEGRTPLHDSIEYGGQKVTELLLARGAYLDICSAAILNREEMVRGHLARNPDAVRDSTTGLSPLSWAGFGNAVDAAALLLQHGADANDGALLCAASVGHVEVGRLLIDHGADPNALFPGNGSNALHMAAAMRYTEDASPFIRMLLGRGANPAVRTRDSGNTARDIAELKAREQEQALAEGRDVWIRRYREVTKLLLGAETQGGHQT